MLRFISFGSGSSGNCYLLYTDTDALIIDAGVGIRTLKKHVRDYGLSLSKVRHVLITHDHADHIKCVGSMSHELQVPIYATKTVHSGIDRNYCVARKVDASLRRYVEPGVAQQLGEFTVTAFTVPHDSSDNVGYFVETADTNFCLMTDVGTVTDEMKGFISQARNLVIEANHDEEMVMSGPYPQFLKSRILSGTGHLSNRNSAIAVAENMSEELRYVWLCHLSEENNHPELARKTVEAVLRGYGIVAGADFKLEVLKRNTATGPFDLE